MNSPQINRVTNRVGLTCLLFSFAAVAATNPANPTPDLDWSQAPAHPVAPATPVSEVKVGDTVHLEVSGAPSGAQVDYPPNSPDLIDDGWDIEKSDSGFLAIPVKPGKLTLPPLAIKDQAGHLIGKTEPWELEVQSAIPKTDPKPTEVVPAKPPLGLAFPTWAAVLLGVLVFVALLVIGYYLWRYWIKLQKERNNIPAVPKTEDEIALLSLLEIENQKYWQARKFKRHYFGVSETLKAYIETRWGFDALEMTSDEIIEKLRGTSLLGDSVRSGLKKMFEDLDRVKFTDHVPEEGEPDRLLNDARQFVYSTRKPKMILEPGAGTHAFRG